MLLLLQVAEMLVALLDRLDDCAEVLSDETTELPAKADADAGVDSGRFWDCEDCVALELTPCTV